MKNRLKVLRAERDWSQAELAARLGVSRQTVNAIERGKYDPSLPLAFKMARLFGNAIEEIFLPEEDAGRSEREGCGGLEGSNPQHCRSQSGGCLARQPSSACSKSSSRSSVSSMPVEMRTSESAMPMLARRSAPISW